MGVKLTKNLFTGLLLVLSVGNLNDLFFIDKYDGTFIVFLFYYLYKIYSQKLKLNDIKNSWIILVVIILPLLITTTINNLNLLQYIKILGLFVTLQVAFTIVRDYSPKELIGISVESFRYASLFCLIVVFVFPGFGVHQSIHIGDWKGIYNHKNVLGYFSLLYLAFVTMLKVIYGKKHAKYYLDYFLSLVLVAGSGSKTAILGSGIILFLIFIIYLSRYYQVNMISKTFIFSSLLVLGGAMFSQVYIGNLGTNSDFISLFGLKLTFTGRLTLWVYCLLSLLESPWIGFGYFGIWKTDLANVGGTGLGDISFQDAHNGYIDMFLSLGIIGAIPVIILFAYMFQFYYQGMKTYNSSNYVTVFLFLILVLLINLTESTFLKVTNIYMLLFFISFAYLFYTDRLKNGGKFILSKSW